MDWWIVSLVLGELLCLVFILAIAALYRLGRLKQKSEERIRLLERFQSADDLQRFLDSERGAQLMTMLGGGSPAAADHRLTRTLGLLGLAFGVVAMAVGIAFLLLAGLDVWGDGEDFLVPGTLCTVIGAGIAVAGILARRLSPAADDRLVLSSRRVADDEALGDAAP